MPLIDINTNRPITAVPYAQDFAAFRKSLSTAEFNAIVARINE